MALNTSLSGTWTWDGTVTVVSDDTSGVAVGDWVSMGGAGPWFEISGVAANASVTILNPDSLSIPSGTGAFRDDGPVFGEIMGAADVVKNVVSEEAITEASAPANTKRPLTEEYTSATVHSTKKAVISYTYGDGAGAKSWGRVTQSSCSVSNV